MLRIILMAGTIAFAAPVMAQDMAAPAAAPQASQPVATTPPVADPNAATTTTDATASTPVPSETTATATTAADATAAQDANAATGNVSSVVSAEFASYDADKSGELSKDEFAKWMIALREKSGAKETADAKTWATKAFAQADKDKSKTVSQSELTTFLQG